MVENVGPVVELLKLFLYFLKAMRLILDQLYSSFVYSTLFSTTAVLAGRYS